MKSRVNKDLLIFIILIPVFLLGSFLITSRIDQQVPNYSTINKARMGYSVFYETLKELGYPVARSLSKIDTHDTSRLQIVVEDINFDVDSPETRAWIKEGGILVYLSYSGYETIQHHQEGAGFLVEANVDGITNNTLMEDTTSAYQLLQAIDQYSYDVIIFNEFYLYTDITKESLWDHIPMSIKFIIYQLILVAMAFFYYKGKAFGRPIPLYEEVEREENEYLYASAALYREAKSWDLMLEIYYKNLLKEMKSTHEDWLEDWQKKQLPNLNKAKKLHEFMDQDQSKHKDKEYMQMVIIIDQLTKILKKRRDTAWKTTKRLQ